MKRIYFDNLPAACYSLYREETGTRYYAAVHINDGSTFGQSHRVGNSFGYKTEKGARRAIAKHYAR